MKNTILNFEKRSAKINDETFEVPDYFSKNIQLTNIIQSNQGAFINHQLNENDKIEKIAMDLYDNPDYWDVIILLNKMQPLNDMVYDDSVIQKSKEKFFERFGEFFSHVKQNDPARYEELKNEIQLKIDEEIENQRYILVVKSSYMPSILRQLKKEGLM